MSHDLYNKGIEMHEDSNCQLQNNGQLRGGKMGMELRRGIGEASNIFVIFYIFSWVINNVNNKC